MMTREAADIWMGCWDIVRSGDAHGTVAMPWRLTALTSQPEPTTLRIHGQGLPRTQPDLLLIPPQRKMSLQLLDGKHVVHWMGFQPGQGMVHGRSVWDPIESARPMPPTDWDICDFDVFRSKVHHPDHRLGRAGGTASSFYHYPLLPMPMLASQQMLPSQGMLEVLGSTQNVPYLHLMEASGVSKQVLALVCATGNRADQSLDLRSFSKNFGTMAALLWCAGSPTSPRKNTWVRSLRDGLEQHVANKATTPGGQVSTIQASQRRAQAVLAMPCFTTLLTDPDLTDDVIDPGAELAPALATQLGCQPSTVRILGAASAGVLGDVLPAMRLAVDDQACLFLMDAMPRSTLRRMAGELSEAGWDGLKDLALEFAGPKPGAILAHIAQGVRWDAGAGWDWLTENPARHGNPWPNRWRHARDVIGEIGRDLIWPALAHENPAEGQGFDRGSPGMELATAALAALGPLRVGRILDAHMEGALRRAREVMAQGGDGTPDWAVPAEPIVTPTGQVIRFLSSQAELAHEGDQMDNCVGDYSDACAAGRCAIMSIGHWGDDKVWIPSSTVEIGRNDSTGELQIRQHQGPGNGDPTPGDAELLAEWFAGLKTGETVFDGDMLPLESVLNHIDHVLGSAWNTPEAHAARWDRWRRILDVRHADAASYFAHVASTMKIEHDDERDTEHGPLDILRLIQDHQASMPVQDVGMTAAPAPR